MANNTKTSLRDMLAEVQEFKSLRDCIREEGLNSTAATRICEYADQMEAAAAAMQNNFRTGTAKLRPPEHEERIKWDDQQAKSLAGLFKDAKPHLKTLADGDKRGEKLRWGNPTTIGGSAVKLNHSIGDLLISEATGTVRDPGAHRDDPFCGMVFNAKAAAASGKY